MLTEANLGHRGLLLHRNMKFFVDDSSDTHHISEYTGI